MARMLVPPIAVAAPIPPTDFKNLRRSIVVLPGETDVSVHIGNGISHTPAENRLKLYVRTEGDA
jgi:hypothetical protein